MVKRRLSISGSQKLRLKTLLSKRTVAAALLLMFFMFAGIFTYSNFFSSVDSKASGVQKNTGVSRLSYFRATPTSSNMVLLEWSALEEIGKDYYSLDRSTDSINFSVIALIQIPVNTSSQRYYSYVDTEPAEGTNYYRLRLTDYRGWCELNKTIPVAMVGNAPMMAQLNPGQVTVQ
jgi:hypothetical protein